MVEKYRDGVVPVATPTTADRGDAEDLAAYHAAMDGSRGYLLHDGLSAVAMLARGNEYAQSQRRGNWQRIRGARAALDGVSGLADPPPGTAGRAAVPIHAGEGTGAVGTARRAGQVRDQRFADFEALMRRDGR